MHNVIEQRENIFHAIFIPSSLFLDYLKYITAARTGVVIHSAVSGCSFVLDYSAGDKP